MGETLIIFASLIILGAYLELRFKTNRNKSKVVPLYEDKIIIMVNNKRYSAVKKNGTNGKYSYSWDYYDDIGNIIIDMVLIDELFSEYESENSFYDGIDTNDEASSNYIPEPPHYEPTNSSDSDYSSSSDSGYSSDSDSGGGDD
jgi:hypothetical protein